MASLRALGAGLLAAGLLAVGSVQAATQTVVNGSFSSTSNGNQTANPWVDSGVSFSGGVARFNNDDEWLYQSLGSFAAGTSFDVSFDFSGENTNSFILRYFLQTSSTSTFAAPNAGNSISLASYTGNQDGTKTFNDVTLGGTGNSFVRIYFGATNRTDDYDAFIDNVSVMATAPIPEPETYALMLAGLGVVGFVARRRRPLDF